jgi:dihydrolipoamide dehydrogenase
METRRVDVAIIGAGTAGLNARREVVQRGGRPLLIESGVYGTTCARVGCMPSKLLIAAAEVAHEVDRAHTFGVLPGDGWRIDGRAVMARVRSERDRFAGGVVEATRAIDETERACGHARFLGPTALAIDDRLRVEAKAVVVAAGSAPNVPPPFDALGAHAMVNDDVFEMDDLPESIAVIGTGIIALELGQALARLGVRVAFFNPFDDLGPFTDPEIKENARHVLCAEMAIHLKALVDEASVEADGAVRLCWRDAGGGRHEDRFARVLVAAGRRPNLDGLDLQRAGIALDERGLPPWNPRTCQSGDAPIFFAGDVNGHLPLLHEAADEGRIAGQNAITYPCVTARVRRTRLAIAFTDPQMAMVGTPFSALPDRDVAFGRVSFADQGRARVIGRNAGAIRLYAERDGCRLIGAEMFGPQMEHMAHLVAWAIQRGDSVQDTLSMPFYHPVLEEGLRTALRDLAQNLGVLGGCRSEDLADSPGM